ncbi:Membrane-bound lysozyme-inhibitor of c-type lysozyme [Pasteurella testudinis DSM 23072]|uniref:Membrane-bound lysozyme-inhibitor of c-type lysozyme n=1 Tax=Pasteurella testudinis DSM 23072 TaxID=1122938 RepID=A0A1W1V2A7_9PAST|nr:c-type lysozyme inhibitor [Pasteurella testudinis]SMB87453.1 Membrane-bound lysozyme-inhibitor of c-type lysozyme [Pasteurella testudinis DSM 23072]SUB50546.1 putative C-type lysozyme, inhibitor [Pasteurella testudinis]
MAFAIKKSVFTAFAATALFFSLPSFAADGATVSKTVQFNKGESSATYQGKIKGNDYDSYFFTAKKGQILNAVLDSNAHAEMVLFGQDGYVVGDSYVLPQNGKYEVRIFQMRTFARRGTESPYSLTIEILNPSDKTAVGSEAEKTRAIEKWVYACRDNKVLEVVYVNSAEQNYAVISQMGELIPMEIIPMASGANYQAINPDYSYKLYTKGNTADLVESDDKPVLSGCVAE